MDYINKVTLQGLVGSIRRTGNHTRFSLATNEVFKHTDGNIIVETTWHDVTTFCPCDFEKGKAIHVEGKIRRQRYTDLNGNERSITEIIATKITKAD